MKKVILGLMIFVTSFDVVNAMRRSASEEQRENKHSLQSMSVTALEKDKVVPPPMTRSRIEPDSVSKRIIEACRKMDDMTELNLQACKRKRMSLADVNFLCERLSQNSTVKILYLGDNNIGEAGADSLGKALSTNSVLTDVYLMWNDIGDAGVSSLSRSLEVNTSLTQLVLAWNNIGESGGKSLGKALEVNSTLTKLDLSTNHIGDT